MYTYTDNDALNILIENASYAERKQIFALTESEQLKVNNEMVARLFNSALKKSHVDFDDIPSSKGDITKYTGYKSMMNSLSQLRQIASTSNMKIPELDIIEKAISNVIAYRDVFEKGFKLGKDFIILQYNTVVAACVISTSSVIASYVDFVKRIDNVEFKIINTKGSAGNICIDSLKTFNKTVASGDFAKVTNSVIKTGVIESVTVASALAIGAGIIGGSILLVTIIRHLIFYFHYSKQKLSDYLELQATFLEMNKNNLTAKGNGMSPDKVKKVMDKQEKLIQKLMSLSDKLKVNATMTEVKATTEMKKENSEWKFDEVKSKTSSQDLNGFQLI